MVCFPTSFYQRSANHVYFFLFLNLRNLLYLIIMGAVIKDLFTNGIPDGYDGLLWIELLTVKHTLTAAEQIKQEGDFVSGITDAEPLSLHEEEISDDNA